jgi:hypothetical protein
MEREKLRARCGIFWRWGVRTRILPPISCTFLDALSASVLRIPLTSHHQNGADMPLTSMTYCLLAVVILPPVVLALGFLYMISPHQLSHGELQ